MFYAGYVDERVVERLPLLLKSAKVRDRKITQDLGSFPGVINNQNWHFMTRTEFIVFPINQYFQKTAFRQARELINNGRNIIFWEIHEDEITGELIDSFLVYSKREIHSSKFDHQSSRIFTKLVASVRTTNLSIWETTLKEITKSKFTNYLELITKNKRFQDTIDSLFETIDATVDPYLKTKEQRIQKLTYVLLFSQNPTTEDLRQTFGDDAEFKAEIVVDKWKKVFKLELDYHSLFIPLDIETYGDIEFFEDVVHQYQEI